MARRKRLLSLLLSIALLISCIPVGAAAENVEETQPEETTLETVVETEIQSAEEIDVVDSTPPQLLGITLSAVEVTAPGTVDVTVEAVDDLSRVADLYVSFFCEETGQTLFCVPEATEMENVFRGTVDIGQYAQSGTFCWQAIHLTDGAGNTKTCSPGEESLPEGLDQLRFSVTATTQTDNTPPELTNLWLSETTIAPPGMIAVGAEVWDAESGVESCYVSFCCEETSAQFSAVLENAEEAGTFHGTLELDAYVQPGVYRWTHIRLEDAAGNLKDYFPTDESLSEEIRTVRFRVLGEIADVTTSVEAPDFAEVVSQAAEDAYIMADFGPGATLPGEIFDALAGTEKILVLTSGDITWRFRGRDIQNASKDIGLDVQVARLDETVSAEGQAISSSLGNAPAMVLEFPDNGQLPGKATLKVNLDGNMQQYLGDDLNLYYCDEGSGELELVAENLSVLQDSYVEFSIDHCSCYVLTAATPLSYSGVCGPDAYWRFDPAAQILTISGTGVMDDHYAAIHTPWYDLRDQIAAILVGDGITRIGSAAFEGLRNLTDVSLPNSLKEIGGNAFYRCPALASVQLPNGLERIEMAAFGESGLTSIVIPASVVDMGDMLMAQVFVNCLQLRSIMVDTGNSRYLSEDGILFDKGKTCLIHYPAQKPDSTYAIPETVEEIAYSAFMGNPYLTDVNLHENLRKIGCNAFSGCSALRQIIVPDSVTTLAAGAFIDCTSLERAVIGRGVTHLEYMFMGCTSLTEVVLPDTIKNIWESSFLGCTSLKRIVLPAGMEGMNEIFEDCTALEEIVIGGIQWMYDPFRNCNALKRVIFAGPAPQSCQDAFAGLTLTAWYPATDSTWTQAIRDEFGGNVTWIPLEGTDTVIRLETQSQVLSSGQKTMLRAHLASGGATAGKILWSLNKEDSAYATLKPNADGTATLTAKKNTQWKQVTVTAGLKDSTLSPMTIQVEILPVASQVKILAEDGSDLTGSTQTFSMETGSDNRMVLLTEVYPAEAGQSVTWKSSNEKQVHVSKSGVVTAKEPGKTVTLTATAADGSGKNATVKIKTLQPMERLTLPEEAVVAGGKNLTLKAAIFPETTTNKKLLWQITEGSDFATISTSGQLKAGKTEQVRSVTVRVSAQENPACFAQCVVTIYPPVTKVDILNDLGVPVTGTTITLPMHTRSDNTMQLSARNDPQNASQCWNWTSSKAADVSVDAHGLVTARVPGKTVTITAAAADGSGKKATVKIKTVQPMEGITITGPAAAAAGKTVTLTAAIQPKTTTNPKLRWEVIQGAEFASIASGGKLKVGKNVTSVQVITVRASWTEDASVCAEYTLPLMPQAVTAVQILGEDGTTITGKTLTVAMATQGENTLQLQAQNLGETVSQQVRWSVSDAKSAQVDENGKVILLQPGKTVTVTAAATDGSGKKSSVKLKTVQPVEQLTLLESPFVAGGKGKNLADFLSVYPGNATNRKLVWQVSDNDHGVKINASSGALSTKTVTEAVTVMVTATAKDGFGAYLQFPVTIYPATTQLRLFRGSEDITGKTLTLSAGEKLYLTAQSQPENAAGRYTWTSSKESSVTVDDSGCVTVIGGSGTVTITCTAADGSGKKATVKIKIG